MDIGTLEDHQLARDSFKKLLELQPVTIEVCDVSDALLAVKLDLPRSTHQLHQTQ